jgi:hypothetical protein
MSLCGACGSDVIVTFGKDRITKSALNRELAAIEANKLYVTRLEQRAGFHVKDARGRFIAAFVAEVLTNDIRYIAARQAAEANHVRIRASDLGPGDALLDAQAVAGNPHILDAFPRWYRDELVRRSATVTRLHQSLLPNISAGAYYATHKDDLLRACEWDIVTASRDKAQAALERIRTGESFQSVAREVSLDKGSGPKGGSLGCNERKNLVPELDGPAFSMPIGTTSAPILVDAHWHLLAVTKRETPALADVGGEVRQALENLASTRYDSLIRVQLQSGNIRVAPAYGVWDRAHLVVAPKAVAEDGSSGVTQRPVSPVRSSNQMDPTFQVGQQVFITTGGFRPKQLVAKIRAPITFTNESGRTQAVTFLGGGFDSGPIRPGGTATFTPKVTVAIVYFLAADPAVRGFIQVENYTD